MAESNTPDGTSPPDRAEAAAVTREDQLIRDIAETAQRARRARQDSNHDDSLGPPARLRNLAEELAAQARIAETLAAEERRANRTPQLGDIDPTAAEAGETPQQLAFNRGYRAGLHGAYQLEADELRRTAQLEGYAAGRRDAARESEALAGRSTPEDEARLRTEADRVAGAMGLSAGTEFRQGFCSGYAAAIPLGFGRGVRAGTEIMHRAAQTEATDTEPAERHAEPSADVQRLNALARALDGNGIEARLTWPATPSEGQPFLAVTLPVLDRHNDHLMVYASLTNANRLLLHDDGDTLSEAAMTTTADAADIAAAERLHRDVIMRANPIEGLRIGPDGRLERTVPVPHDGRAIDPTNVARQLWWLAQAMLAGDAPEQIRAAGYDITPQDGKMKN